MTASLLPDICPGWQQAGSGRGGCGLQQTYLLSAGQAAGCLLLLHAWEMQQMEVQLLPRQGRRQNKR